MHTHIHSKHLYNHYLCVLILGIRVPRSRFLPVKTTSDLVLVMSDLYTVTNGSLVMNPNRGFMSVPLVKLGEKNFKKVIEY